MLATRLRAARPIRPLQTGQPTSCRKFVQNPRKVHSKTFSFTPNAPMLRRPKVSDLYFRRFYTSYNRGSLPWQTRNSALQAVWALIGLNTAVYGLWNYALISRDSKLLHNLHTNFTASWANWQTNRYWTLLTSAFSHVNLVHFAFNMINLYAFGTILASFPGIGAGHIVGLTVGSAIAGSGFWLWGSSGSASNKLSRAMGASGVVMGMGAAAACLMPFAPMYVMFIPVAVPLYAVTGLYAAVDLFFLRSNDSPIGHAAHLGGGAFGALFYLVFLRGHGGISRIIRRGLRR